MSDPILNPVLARPTNGLATASLVLGIVAIVGSFIPVFNVISIILAVLAFVFALVGLRKARKVRVGTKSAVAGLILSGVAVVIAIAVNVATASVVNDVTSSLESPDVTAAEPEATKTEAEAEPLEEETEEPAPEPEEPTTTLTQDQALRHAEQYLSTLPFSKTGLITQLTDFEGHEQADAEYGVNHVDVDWNEQAALQAQNYLDTMAFSREGLITQLVDFEGFTVEQATYGVDQTGL